MFRENIRPVKKEMNKAVTMLTLSDACSYAINHYISLSLINRKSSVHLHALYSPRIALRTLTPQRDHLVMYGQYFIFLNRCATMIIIFKGVINSSMRDCMPQITHMETGNRNSEASIKPGLSQHNSKDVTARNCRYPVF
jgi:hypothetical protein